MHGAPGVGALFPSLLEERNVDVPYLADSNDGPSQEIVLASSSEAMLLLPPLTFLSSANAGGVHDVMGDAATNPPPHRARKARRWTDSEATNARTRR